MTAKEKIHRIKKVLKKVNDFEWGHAEGCQMQSCPYDECQNKFCDPLHHIGNICKGES